MIARLTSRHALRVVAALTMLSPCCLRRRLRASAPMQTGPEDRIRKESRKALSATSTCSVGRMTPIENNGIGVNGFLWRASLDTISFLPLTSADPFGGVIITDWYTPPESPAERFKVTVYILGRELRADGVRVAVFRQKREQPVPTGWTPSTGKNTSTSLENAILSRARELRVSQRRRASRTASAHTACTTRLILTRPAVSTDCSALRE